MLYSNYLESKPNKEPGKCRVANSTLHWELWGRVGSFIFLPYQVGIAKGPKEQTPWGIPGALNLAANASP